MEFTSALKVLLEQVPLQVDIQEMLTHWKWFGEWSIGCIGILSDWVVETAATLCRVGETVLTLEALAMVLFSYSIQACLSPPTLVSSKAPRASSDAFCASESPRMPVILSRS